MSNEDHQQPASSAIPLLVPHKKKQSGKVKTRVRPSRALKKNGPPKRKIVPSRSAGSSSIGTASISRKEGSASIADVPAAALPPSSSIVSKSVASKTKVVLRKPIRKAAKPIRPSKISSTAKKGLSLNIGSAMSKRSSIQAGSSRKESSQSQPIIQTKPRHQDDVNEDQFQSREIATGQIQSATSDDVVGSDRISSTPEAADEEVSGVDNTNDEDLVEIIPYQHLGQIDPDLNIAPPKEGEKTMKDFCSKFKIPKAQRTNQTNNEENNNNANDGNNQTNTAAEGSGSNAAATAGLSTEPTEAVAEVDNRSGPLVEIINGEIVVKESSMIVGGRRTMEEVDREMEGAIVVEENTGITATYNSFTKRQKMQRWNVEETRKFYTSLRQCGTDFSTMESFFDGEDGGNKRTRKQLKGKYKRECRNNLHLIDMAMNPKVQLPMDMSVFGELDMDAVGAVVPLGQASAQPISGEDNATKDVTTSEQTPVLTSMDTNLDNGEPEVVVETYGEDNAAAPAIVTQSQNTDNNITAGTSEIVESSITMASGVSVDDKADEEDNNIPLLAMPTSTKRKARPKFRAKPKGKAKAKRPKK